MKYIFVAGAPGSKWSSVVKNIYYSADIDRSDYREEWTYYHDAGDTGVKDLMHMGAYFDPGMESNLPDNLDQYSREELEQLFDKEFSGTGIRIIKSHIFSNHIEFIKKTWPECPLILVHRSDDSCLGWWVKCGHFNITYPLYHEYYVDLKTMATIIKQQNKGILDAWWKYNGLIVTDNKQLSTAVNIQAPLEEYRQDYVVSDIKVKVI
jgi:hypothetical protein